jgi:hypothetical protein
MREDAVSARTRRIRVIRGLCVTSKAILPKASTTDHTDSTDLHGFLKTAGGDSHKLKLHFALTSCSPLFSIDCWFV